MSKKRGRPPKNEEDKLRGYRYSLNLDRDLKDYLHEAAWRKRTSITQYINDLIRADMQRNIKEIKHKKEQIITIPADEFTDFLSKYIGE